MTFQKGDIVTFTDTLPSNSCTTLTKDRDYQILNVNGKGWVKVKNDRGSSQHYKPSRFQLSQKATTMSTFTMKLNPKQASYEIEADAPNGVLRITAGCFSGTLAEAYDRADGRSYYTTALDLIEQTAKAMGILTEPEKTHDLTLTQAECDFLALVGMKIAGSPETTARRESESIRIKLKKLGISIRPQTRGKIAGGLKMLPQS